MLKSLVRMSSCINSFPEVKHRDKQRLKSQLRCTRSFFISFEKIHLPTFEIRQENVIIKLGVYKWLRTNGSNVLVED